MQAHSEGSQYTSLNHSVNKKQSVISAPFRCTGCYLIPLFEVGHVQTTLHDNSRHISAQYKGELTSCLVEVQGISFHSQSGSPIATYVDQQKKKELASSLELKASSHTGQQNQIPYLSRFWPLSLNIFRPLLGNFSFCCVASNNKVFTCHNYYCFFYISLVLMMSDTHLSCWHR